MTRSRSSSPSPSSFSSLSPRSRSHTPDQRRRGEDCEGRCRRTGTRVHVGSLAGCTSNRELRHMFAKFGEVVEVWMAHTQPCFAFVVFRRHQDAIKAVRDMDGETLHSRRMRVTLARPRTKGTRTGAFNPYLRCYQCGKRGHFSRDCRAHQWTPERAASRWGRDRSEREGWRERGDSPPQSRRHNVFCVSSHRRY